MTCHREIYVDSKFEIYAKNIYHYFIEASTPHRSGLIMMLSRRNRRKILLMCSICAILMMNTSIIIIWNLETLKSKMSQYQFSDLYQHQESLKKPDKTEGYVKLRTDSSFKNMSEIEILLSLNKDSNVPLDFLSKTKIWKMTKKGCAVMPNALEINFNNVYWQELRILNFDIYLYNAFYDRRPLATDGPIVRILGMIDYREVVPKVEIVCQIWFDHLNEPVISNATKYTNIWRPHWSYSNTIGMLHPFLISCPLPDQHQNKIPSAVSLVAKPCEKSTNILRVIFNELNVPVKKKFAVCVKGLDFLTLDFSVYLIEWLEMQFLLGAEKVFMYELQIHPNMSKVLNYYKKLNKVEVYPITLPGKHPNLPGFIHYYNKYHKINKRKNELVPYNDCLYKNMYRYDYLALLDIDEFIIPLKNLNWSELMDKVIKEVKTPKSCYAARCAYFKIEQLKYGYYNLTKYLTTVNNILRAKNLGKPLEYVKSFFDPLRIFTIHNHAPLLCLDGPCSIYELPVVDAQLNHYRIADALATNKRIENNLVTDTTMWRYKEDLIVRTSKVLQKLRFL